MVMRRIRHSKKTMRLPLIIMTLILGFGLVGSFAIWSAPNVNTNGNKAQITPEEQIANLQASIDTWEKSLQDTPKDFSLLKSLADVRYEQAGLYVQTENYDKSQEVFQKSLENYLAALDNAPEELNNKGKADIMVQAATCAWHSSQNEVADALFQQAKGLVPDDFDTIYSYVLFLALGKQDFPQAKSELEAYKGTLKAGDALIAEIDQYIKGIEDLENAVKTPKDGEKTEKPAEEEEK